MELISVSAAKPVIAQKDGRSIKKSILLTITRPNCH
jgi:hypothetical protein